MPLDQVYNYDSLNRIASAEEKTGTTVNWNQTYTFDRYGNRNFNESLTTTLPKGCMDGSTPVVCEADKKMLDPDLNPANNRMAPGQDWSYDAAGNVIGDPQGRIFFYDAENKQVEVENSLEESIGKYWFDGDGKRIKKDGIAANGQPELTVFVYDAGSKMIGEYSTNVETAAPKVQYLTADHLGSPRINTGQNGTVTSRSDYMPYGEEIIALGGRSANEAYSPDDIRKGFTGYVNDGETGLDFAQARYYRRYLGRFTSADPVKLTPSRLIEPQRLNLYPYTINNPMRYTDPDGKDVNLVNDTKEGRRKALLSITANMTAGEAKNVGVRWNKDTKKNEVYIKDPSKIDASKASRGYADLVDRVGNRDLKLDFTFLEKGKSTSVEIGGVKTTVTQKALSGSGGGDAGGFVAPQSDGTIAVVVAEGGYVPGVKGLTASGQETKGTIAFPDYLVTAHELFGETYKYTPAGTRQGLQNNIIDDSNTVIKIENDYRDFHGVPRRSGTDHGYVQTTVTVTP